MYGRSDHKSEHLLFAKHVGGIDMHRSPHESRFRQATPMQNVQRHRYTHDLTPRRCLVTADHVSIPSIDVETIRLTGVPAQGARPKAPVMEASNRVRRKDPTPRLRRRTESNLPL